MNDYLNIPRDNLINCVMMLYYQIAGNITNFKADVTKKRDTPLKYINYPKPG